VGTVEEKLTAAVESNLRTPSLIHLLNSLAETARPGAAIVRNLRQAQQRDEAHFAEVLVREFRLLGILVASAASSKGGLIVEASARETDRIAAVVGAARIEEFEEARLLPAFRDHYKRMLETVATTLRGANLPVTVRQSLESSMLDMGGKRMGLLDIPGDVKDSLFKVLDAGRELGLNPRTSASWIEYLVPRGRFVNAGARYRAQLIARTETMHAQRMSSIRMYRQSPVVKEVIAFDGEDDEECAERNGSYMSFDEAEEAADSTHPNCVLAFGPSV
jgi:hypothetical protein